MLQATTDQTPARTEYRRKFKRAHERAQDALSPNTRRAYRADWQCFQSWCSNHGVSSEPATPETVATYISDLADNGKAASTIKRRMVTIRKAHRLAGHDAPTDAEHVRTVWKAIQRDDTVKTAQQGKAPLLIEDVREMVGALDTDTLSGKRDRALILLGFAGGFRRAELAALDAEDVTFTARGIIATVQRSKTDQTGQGHEKTIHASNSALCPVKALRAWLAASEIHEGAMFRTVGRWDNMRDSRISGRTVNNVVKRTAERAGLDVDTIGAHSLRAGHVTQRKIAGDGDDAIMQTTGHTSASTMYRYDRAAKRFRHNVTQSLGL